MYIFNPLNTADFSSFERFFISLSLGKKKINRHKEVSVGLCAEALVNFLKGSRVSYVFGDQNSLEDVSAIKAVTKPFAHPAGTRVEAVNAQKVIT